MNSVGENTLKLYLTTEYEIFKCVLLSILLFVQCEYLKYFHIELYLCMNSMNNDKNVGYTFTVWYELTMD